MRETISIPREELFEFKKRNGLTAREMASHFGVKCPTFDGWLYRRSCKMSPTSYNMVMRKLAEGDISLPESPWQPPKDITLPLIATAIKGDAESCWLHYAYEVYPHHSEEKQIILEYTRVRESTLKRWIGLIMPEGQNLLRLRCFLGHRGYGVTEFEKLSGLFKTLVYLIADWKIPFIEASGRLGYKQVGGLIEVLLGGVGMSDERLDRCRSLIAEYANVKIVQKETPACGDDVEVRRAVEEVPVLMQFNRQEAQSPILRVNGSCRWEVENLAALVRMMLPLAERVLSDEHTEQDRERLRTLVNGDGVFRLSNALNGLCGPRVRVRMMTKQEGE